MAMTKSPATQAAKVLVESSALAAYLMAPKLTQVSRHWGRHEQTMLVIQGGGALGAYQAGVYAALKENGLEVNWVTGVSIGAINAALIAGNPPDRQVERLREFLDRMSKPAPFALPVAFALFRPMINQAHAASAAIFGVPGFFEPRKLWPILALGDSMDAVSLYDTQPLKGTLLDLVDFDYIARKNVRLSLEAVNVTTGDSVYFDSTKMRIEPEHFMASGALPPAFPPLEIDGELYWDGGTISNSPLTYGMAEIYRNDALIFQIDLFSGLGERPDELQSDPDLMKLKAVSTRRASTLVHFINRHNTH